MQRRAELTFDRDAKTPDEQINQILAVAPILEGSHRRNSKYELPPLHHQESAVPNHNTSGHMDTTKPLGGMQSEQSTQSISDLIDFAPHADKNAAASKPALVPTNKGVSEAGRVPATGGKGGLEDMRDMKASVPHVEKTEDSDDEFVDASED